MSTMAPSHRGAAWVALRLAAPGTGRPAPRAAVRMALALGGPLIVGLAIGRPVLGMIAALAAFFTALIEPVGGYRAHVTVYMVMVPVNAAVAALASFVAGTIWQAGIAGLAVGLASGILVGSTSRAAVAGPFPLFLFVVVQGTAPQPEVWTAAAAAATGALWVALASIVLLPFAPFAPGEVHVAEGWKAVALLARAPRDPRRHVMALSALEGARMNLIAMPGRTARWQQRRRQLWASLLDAEAAMVGIVALGASGAQVKGVLDPASRFAEQVARHAVWHRRPPDNAVLADALEEARDTLPAAEARMAERMVGRMHTGCAALRGDDPGGPPIPTAQPRRIIAPLAAAARWGSPGFRHGLRLGIGAGGLMAVIGAYDGSLFDLTTHGAWVTITLVDVLAPSLGASVQRVTQRALGTAVGGIIAALLIWVLGDPWLVALVAVAIGTTAALIRFVNYAWFMALFTPLVLLVASTAAPMGPDIAVQRTIATLIGCGLGFALALLVLPTRQEPDLPGALATAVDAVADDLDAGLAAARAGAPISQLAGVHRRAMTAADDALQMFDGVVLESLSRRLTRSPLSDMEVATFTLVERTAILGTRLPDPTRLIPGTEAAVEGLSQSLRGMAVAIRTRTVGSDARPLPTPPDAAPDARDDAQFAVVDAITGMIDAARRLDLATRHWLAGAPAR